MNVKKYVFNFVHNVLTMWVDLENQKYRDKVIQTTFFSFVYKKMFYLKQMYIHTYTNPSKTIQEACFF